MRKDGLTKDAAEVVDAWQARVAHFRTCTQLIKPRLYLLSRVPELLSSETRTSAAPRAGSALCRNVDGASEVLYGKPSLGNSVFRSTLPPRLQAFTLSSAVALDYQSPTLAPRAPSKCLHLA